MATATLLRERAERVGAKLSLFRQDIIGDLHWSVLGGQRFFHRHAREILEAHKWCFIFGCNNSGTSLLKNLLERSGRVSTMPREGQRYTRAFLRSSRRGHERVWTEYLSELRLSAGDDLSRLPRLLHDWMAQIELPIREIIVEKTPANAVRMPWLQKAFPRSYFIGLVRNGYAVTEGICRKGHKSAERGARHWNMVNRIMMEDSKDIDHFLLVQYENLVLHPEATARQIEEFLGLDNQSLQGPIEGKFSLATVLGGGEQPIRDFNGESIRKLGPEEISVIRLHAAEMLDCFGYHAGAA